MNENVILDFDGKKKLVGIEILSATKVLSPEAMVSIQKEVSA